jgi:hypothetical protein
VTHAEMTPPDPFKLEPGAIHVYWRDSVGGSAAVRERVFIAAAAAEALGSVRLHLRRGPDGEIEYIAVGRCTK